MLDHAEISLRTVSTEKAKLWNPSKTLGIINPDSNCLTCVGYAPSQGRRCRNPIRADNRALINRTLDEIEYLPPGSPAVMSRLRAIAGPALCVRYHQDQAERVVMQWQKKIQLFKPQNGERKPAKPVQGSRLQNSARDRGIENLQDQLKELMEAMAKLREEIKCEEQEERSVEDRQEEERKQQRREERRKEARKKESERLEKERLEEERLEKERLKKERLEEERLAKEKKEKEEKQRRKGEEAAANERIRQRAQKIREERKLAERKEWDQLWANYQDRWAQFKASASDVKEEGIRDAIPWPVKSSSYRDVKNSNVKEFFQKAMLNNENKATLIRKELLKWHPDKRSIWLGDTLLNTVDKMMVDMVCRVLGELLNKPAEKLS